MDSLAFFKAVSEVFKKQKTILHSEVNRLFLIALNTLVSDKDATEALKITRMSILFEGFYRHLEDSDLKKTLLWIRIKRWKNHFGTPTVTFLLSYKNPINLTAQYFDNFLSAEKPITNVPWVIAEQTGFMFDNENSVIINPEIISQIDAPSTREETGIFTKTHNPFGGYTTAPCDPISQQFIEYSTAVAKSGGRVLEIGAAFGAATLEAVSKGATVYCNDIEPENLAVVRKRYTKMTGEQYNSLMGSDSKLVLIPGEFPDELAGLPKNYFDAILICRVLHFFTGAKIEESLTLMSKLLIPGGKIYIVCETPFLKNWQKFIPEFNKRVKNNDEWPGEITNPAEYESSGRASALPRFVHWITKEIIERSLLRTGFDVEQVSYINRLGQFPEDLLLPEYGQESVGAIGINRGVENDAKSKLA